MGTLVLVRHGQASYGAADYDRLSERGVEQARALGRRWAEARFAPTAIYVGPMKRQRDTAALACETARAAGHPLPEPVELPELAEYPAFELLARFLPGYVQQHPELARMTDGTLTSADRHALMDRGFGLVIDAWCNDQLDCGDIETFGGFIARVRAGLARMTAAHGDGGARVVAVTSGGPIGIALKLALALDAAATMRHWQLVRNASITELLWRSQSPEQLSLLTFNHVDHLAPEMITFR
jgi:broad specificity phosphatase PhoE